MVSKSFIKNVKRERNNLSRSINESSVIVDRCNNNPSIRNIESMVREWTCFGSEYSSSFSLMINEVNNILSNNKFNKCDIEFVVESVLETIKYLPENTLKNIKNKMFFTQGVFKENAELFANEASDILSAIRVNENMNKIEEKINLSNFCVYRESVEEVIDYMIESYPKMESKQRLNIMIESISMAGDYNQKDLLVEAIWRSRLMDNKLTEDDIILCMEKSACISEQNVEYIKSLYNDSSVLNEGLTKAEDSKKIIDKFKAAGSITKESLEKALMAARKLSPEHALTTITTILYTVLTLYLGYYKVFTFPITSIISMIVANLLLIKLAPKAFIVAYKALLARISKYEKKAKELKGTNDEKAKAYQEVIEALQIEARKFKQIPVIQEYEKESKKANPLSEEAFAQSYIDPDEVNCDDLTFEESLALIESLCVCVEDIISLKESEATVLSEGTSVATYLKLAKTKIQQSLRNASSKEKTICKKMDDAFDNALVAVQKSVTSDQREKVVKGRVLPALSKMIKYALVFGTVWVVNPVIAIIGTIGAMGVSKKATKTERKYILDEIDIQLKIVNRKINQAELLNEEEKLEQLYRLKRKLENEHSRIKYKLAVRHTLN